jgi:hypothetical protein
MPLFLSNTICILLSLALITGMNNCIPAIVCIAAVVVVALDFGNTSAFGGDTPTMYGMV